MDIKMIVCDLDGTLLRTDKTVSKYTLNMLNKYRAAGVKFAVATARSAIGARIFTEVMMPDALIYNGGAGAVMGGDIIYNQELSSKVASHIVRDILRHGHTYLSAEGEYGFFYNGPPDYSYAIELARHGQRAEHTDFAQGLDVPVHKVRAALDMATAQKVAQKFADVDIISYHGEPWVRFGHIRATKWWAIEACAARFGIDAMEIVAFGDDYNDLEMLKNCGVGVAVANAIPEAKAVADFICEDNDKDGVAKWLEARVLKGDLT